MFSKKRCFFYFEWKKLDFTISPPEKYFWLPWKNPLLHPGKNSSDAHFLLGPFNYTVVYLRYIILVWSSIFSLKTLVKTF